MASCTYTSKLVSALHLPAYFSDEIVFSCEEETSRASGTQTPRRQRKPAQTKTQKDSVEVSAEFARAAGPQVELTRAIGCEPSQPRDKAWIGDHGKLKSAKAGFVLGIAECDHTDRGLVPESWQS